MKSRGSSADHSREGSSDDGCGRYTLSPSTNQPQQHSSQQNLPNQYQSSFHARQGSAPAIMNSPAPYEYVLVFLHSLKGML